MTCFIYLFVEKEREIHILSLQLSQKIKNPNFRFYIIFKKNVIFKFSVFNVIMYVKQETVHCHYLLFKDYF